ncbi:MAG: hypothetical protein V5A43_03150 [Haloarculaceae archaeon]
MTVDLGEPPVLVVSFTRNRSACIDQCEDTESETRTLAVFADGDVGSVE